MAFYAAVFGFRTSPLDPVRAGSPTQSVWRWAFGLAALGPLVSGLMVVLGLPARKPVRHHDTHVLDFRPVLASTESAASSARLCGALLGASRRTSRGARRSSSTPASARPSSRRRSSRFRHVRAHVEAARGRSALARLGAVFGRRNHLRAFGLTMALNFSGFLIVPFIAPYFVANVGIAETELPVTYFFGGRGGVVRALRRPAHRPARTAADVRMDRRRLDFRDPRHDAPSAGRAVGARCWPRFS